MVREIREELGATLRELRLLRVVENIFELDGELGHEVVFVYAGRLAEADVVPVGGAEFHDDGRPMWVEWRPVQDAALDMPLYPEEVAGLLPDLVDGMRCRPAGNVSGVTGGEFGRS